MTPGQVMAFMTKLGKASGIWGFNNGSQYNARVESLDTTWKTLNHNRGILAVDSFWEKGKQFVRPDGKLFKIGVIYNPKAEFAVVTAPANEVVIPYHGRMPLILADNEVDYWLQTSEGGQIWMLPKSEFVLRAA